MKKKSTMESVAINETDRNGSEKGTTDSSVQ
jgi:hypothetical protein